MTQPKCAGRWELFDSSDLDDHEKAKALCAACDWLEWCRAQLRRAQEETELAGWGPSGTWAGSYIGARDPGSRPRRRVAACGTPSGYKRHYRLGEPYCDACKAAQAAYVRASKVKEAS